MKAGVQAVLAQIPGGEFLNHQLQILNGFHSRLQWEVQNNIAHLATLVSVIQQSGVKPDGAVTVEVGTGWVPTLPLGMYLLGAEVHTYDHVSHARMANIKRLLDCYPTLLGPLSAHADERLLRARLEALAWNAKSSVQDWLRPFGIYYHAPGDAAQSGLAAESVDLHFSVAVLEHVPENAVQRMLGEAYRILKPNGLTYHHIGLHDHYSEIDAQATYVNFLQYSDSVWKILGQNRVQFHNRLRNIDFLRMFKEAGFEVIHYKGKVDETSLRALETMRLNPRFRNYERRDLATYAMTICARKRA